MRFEDLKFEPKAFTGGHQATVRFDNGYGASIIDDGYGSERGLYELAVLDEAGHICYDTEITDDVEGYLNAQDVTNLLERIEALCTNTPSTSLTVRVTIS